jgi:hypothetical protein
MTIVYDAEAKRATHVESGLSVRFLHYGPYLKEPDAYFEARYGQHVFRFKAACIGPGQKIKERYPDLPPGDEVLLALEMRERDYKYQGTDGDDLSIFINTIGESNIKNLLETWANAAKNAARLKKTTVSMYLGKGKDVEYTL